MHPLLRVTDALPTEHDPYALAAALVLCLLASLTTLGLLSHARRTGSTAWLVAAAIVCGFGIWATHLTGLQAFRSDLPNGFAALPTLVALATATALAGLGLRIALAPRRGASWLGGAVLGGGIALAHSVGMAGFEIPGRLDRNLLVTCGAVALALILAAAAVRVAVGGRGWRRGLLAILLLAGAIAGYHLAAMSAVTAVADPSVGLSSTARVTRWVVVAVTGVGFAILLLTAAALLVDKIDRYRSALDGERMRGLVNAVAEGLLLCRDTIIVTANPSFAALAGEVAEDLAGLPLDKFLPQEAVLETLRGAPGRPIETVLRRGDGEGVAVELILQPIEFRGATHNAIAVRDLRERKKAEEDIRFLAQHDALTGLPNRASFMQGLEAAIADAAPGERVAVICLGLDRFKKTNDLFGQAAGDAVLQGVARCVAGALDEGQSLARLGGDEFGIVVTGIADLAGAVRVAEAILRSLGGAGTASGPLVAASIGIALWPDPATDAAALLGDATTALYRAKAEGGGLCRIFDPEMGAQVRERRILEHDLRFAVERGQFHLVYQPQTAIETGEVIGFEVLLRWHHPERGNVPPDRFIQIAEETGSIEAVGEWVLRTACREAASWAQPLRIAVNVSAVQIHSARLSGLVREILVETGLAPERLELEITETALIRDFDRALASLRLLKALGVRIAMDDFGTGYSSLSNLRAFPFDKIKIDRSFIMSVDSNDQAAAIVRAVMGLGRGLALPVLAEGVETQGELAFLMNEGCQEAQGYLMGKPALISHFAHVVDEAAAKTAAADEGAPGRRSAA
jgi:diguanylate cyclase (GGDEF)-like protein/PAS domain S-box-containing protein